MATNKDGTIALHDDLVKMLENLDRCGYDVPTRMTVSVSVNLNEVRQVLSDKEDLEQASSGELSTAIFNYLSKDFIKSAIDNDAGDILERAEFFLEGEHCTVKFVVSNCPKVQEPNSESTALVDQPIGTVENLSKTSQPDSDPYVGGNCV